MILKYLSSIQLKNVELDFFENDNSNIYISLKSVYQLLNRKGRYSNWASYTVKSFDLKKDVDYFKINNQNKVFYYVKINLAIKILCERDFKYGCLVNKIIKNFKTKKVSKPLQEIKPKEIERPNLKLEYERKINNNMMYVYSKNNKLYMTLLELYIIIKDNINDYSLWQKSINKNIINHEGIQLVAIDVANNMILKYKQNCEEYYELLQIQKDYERYLSLYNKIEDLQKTNINTANTDLKDTFKTYKFTSNIIALEMDLYSLNELPHCSFIDAISKHLNISVKGTDRKYNKYSCSNPIVNNGLVVGESITYSQAGRELIEEFIVLNYYKLFKIVLNKDGIIKDLYATIGNSKRKFHFNLTTNKKLAEQVKMYQEKKMVSNK